MAKQEKKLGRTIFGLYMDGRERADLVELSRRLEKSKADTIRFLIHAGVTTFTAERSTPNVNQT